MTPRVYHAARLRPSRRRAARSTRQARRPPYTTAVTLGRPSPLAAGAEPVASEALLVRRIRPTRRHVILLSFHSLTEVDTHAANARTPRSRAPRSRSPSRRSPPARRGRPPPTGNEKPRARPSPLPRPAREASRKPADPSRPTRSRSRPRGRAAKKPTRGPSWSSRPRWARSSSAQPPRRRRSRSRTSSSTSTTKFYDGTIFHRVIDGFMIQGGGFDARHDAEEDRRAPIVLEAAERPHNKRGTIAMARTGDPTAPPRSSSSTSSTTPSSTTARAGGEGYAVFGEVVDGMAVVDRSRRSRPGRERHGERAGREGHHRVRAARRVAGCEPGGRGAQALRSPGSDL